MDFQNDEWYYNDDNQAIVLPTVPYRCVQIATYTDELGMKHTAYLLFLPEVPRGQLFPTLYNQIIGEQGMLMYGRLGWVPSRFVVDFRCQPFNLTTTGRMTSGAYVIFGFLAGPQ